MKILAVDDERTALNILERAIMQAAPDAELRSFQTVTAAVAELMDKRFVPDAAFLDIEMPGMTGLELAQLLKTIVPRLNIIFVTGYSQYAMEAMAIRPSGYVMKPVDKEQILTELANLRNPPARLDHPKRIRVQCFGDFEVFVDGQAVPFPRAKSKELLAFLVDRRGTSCSAARIAEVLWEDGQYDRMRQKQLSTIRADLVKALHTVGAESMLKRTNSEMAIDPEAFDCDFYFALKGDTVAINSFLGEYMAAYSWAEYTTASLVSHFSGITGYAEQGEK